MKIEQTKAIHRFPSLSLFMGKPKVGKSTSMAQVPNVLILATDPKGYEDVDTKALVKAYSLGDVYEAVKYFFSAENKAYKVLVIDELRSLTVMFDNEIKKKEGVKYSVDIGFGRGSSYMRDDIYNFVNAMKVRLSEQPDKYVFMVAHADDRNGEIRLDVTGKNETMVLGLVDSIGYLNRDLDGNTTIDFGIRKGVEFGTRNKFLSGYSGTLMSKEGDVLKANWTDLFSLAEGKKQEKLVEVPVSKQK